MHLYQYVAPSSAPRCVELHVVNTTLWHNSTLYHCLDLVTGLTPSPPIHAKFTKARYLYFTGCKSDYAAIGAKDFAVIKSCNQSIE